MYTDSIVLFIDILGFKELVCDKSSSFNKVNAIYDEFNTMIRDGHNRFSEQTQIFENVLKKKSGNKGDSIQLDRKYQNLIFFSDCVVWTYPVFDFFHLSALTGLSTID